MESSDEEAGMLFWKTVCCREHSLPRRSLETLIPAPRAIMLSIAGRSWRTKARSGKLAVTFGNARGLSRYASAGQAALLALGASNAKAAGRTLRAGGYDRVPINKRGGVLHWAMYGQALLTSDPGLTEGLCGSERLKAPAAVSVAG